LLHNGSNNSDLVLVLMIVIRMMKIFVIILQIVQCNFRYENYNEN